MIASKAGSDLYIRTPFYKLGYDKVWRIRAGAPVTETTNGVVDFYGERLISSVAPQTFGKEYNQSANILRYGGEEPPTILADGSVAMGGNHKIGGRSSVVYYKMLLEMDGKPFPAKNASYICNSVTIRENYGIPATVAFDINRIVPLRCSISNEFHFDMSGLCRVKHTLTCMRPMTLDLMLGMMAQRPNVMPGQTLHLIVPGSNLSAGVDITNETTDRFLPPSDWTDANKPPAHFIQEIRQGGTPYWAFVMGYTSTNRGTLATAFNRANGKLKPHGYEGPEDLLPGMAREVSCYFGFYPR